MPPMIGSSPSRGLNMNRTLPFTMMRSMPACMQREAISPNLFMILSCHSFFRHHCFTGHVKLRMQKHAYHCATICHLVLLQ